VPAASPYPIGLGEQGAEHGYSEGASHLAAGVEGVAGGGGLVGWDAVEQNGSDRGQAQRSARPTRIMSQAMVHTDMTAGRRRG
jgi:hypothetical protein